MFENIVSFIFRLLNFAVLIGLTIYLFKKYFLVSLQVSAHEENAIATNLQSTIAQLDTTIAHKTTEQTRLQEQGALLKKQLHAWQEKVLTVQKEQSHAAKHARELATQRVKVQEQNLHQKKLMKKTLPGAMCNARHELENYFSREENVQKYVSHIADTLNRETHGN